MKLKKILISFLVILFCSLNAEAKENVSTIVLSKTKPLPIKVDLQITNSKINLSSSCDDYYNWQVSIALSNLEFLLTNPPSGADQEYYDWVWGNFNWNIKEADKYRKNCKSLSIY